MFNILIIDDEPSRREALAEIFKHDNFNLEFIFQKSDFFRKEGDFEIYDCIACDISLDNWLSSGDTKNMFDTVLRTIGKNIPIVIFSSKVTEVIRWTNKLLDAKYPLIYTIGLQKTTETEQLEEKIYTIESNQIITNNIYTLLLSKNDFSTLKKGPDDDINILHISDLQFGDPEFNESLSNSFVPTLRRKIKDKDIPEIDFIIITGDISWSGTLCEYDTALRWVLNLCNNIIGENFQDRLVLVPGNHDANLSICSLNHYEYHFPKEEIEEEKIIFDSIVPSHNYTFYSMSPFRIFAYKLTKDIRWIENESMSFFNFKFGYLGFKILQLNVVVPDKQLGKKEAIFEIDHRTIDSLRDSLKDNDRLLNLPTLVFTHSSPTHLGYNVDEEPKGNWVSILNFLNEINTTLFAFGHRHKNIIHPVIPITQNKGIKVCGTGTLLSDSDKCDCRGFEIIKIERKDSKIVSSDFIHYDYKNDGKINLSH